MKKLKKAVLAAIIILTFVLLAGILYASKELKEGRATLDFSPVGICYGNKDLVWGICNLI